jgi:hypothetical protein
MPWVMSVRNRNLEVDLASGVRGREWEQLLAKILEELGEADRVLFLVPRDFEEGNQAAHLDGLVKAITSRGIDVERRQVR